MTVDPVRQFADHYAFLVGIEEYDDPRFGPLTGTYADAQAMRNTLLEIGYPESNLWLVPPERMSLRGIIDDLREFMGVIRSRTGNLLPEIVVYWAGHGVPDDRHSFLVVTSSEAGKLEHSALTVEDVVGSFTREFVASVTMFFDVCHSVPRSWPLPDGSQRGLLLGPMRDVAVRNRRWAFAGISTWAYEHEVGEVGDGGADYRGLMAGALEGLLRGRSDCPDDRDERSSADGAVSVDLLLRRLAWQVTRRARDLGVDQRVVALTDRGPTASSGSSTIIGFDLERLLAGKLEDERVPLATKLLVAVAAEKERSSAATMTAFGNEVVGLVRDFTLGRLQVEEFLRHERARVRHEVLRLRSDKALGPYVYFLLKCRHEAAREGIVTEVLRELYAYLVSGDAPARLAEFLRPRAEMFAWLDNLPWSCGIRAMLGDEEQGYAPILYAGGRVLRSSDGVSTTLVATRTPQRKARIEIYVGDSRASSVRDLAPCDEESWRNVKFSHDLDAGAGVWAKMGRDEDGCGSHCEGSRPEGVYIPMKLLLGFEDDPEVDRKVHWHLELEPPGVPDDIAGTEASVPLSPQVRSFLDECARWLETWDTEDDGEQAVVDFLYYAEKLIRERDVARLRDALEVLIAAWRNDRPQIVPLLTRALLGAVGSPDVPVTVDDGRDRSQEALEEYASWRLQAQRAREQPDRLRRVEVLAALLEAVVASDEKAAAEPSAQGVAQLMSIEPGGAHERLNDVMDRLEEAAASGSPRSDAGDGARTSLALFVVAVERFAATQASHRYQRELVPLSAWAQSARTVSGQTDAQDTLRSLFTVLRSTIGLATAVVARGFLHATGLEPTEELEESLTQLQHREGELGIRQAAEKLYRSLQRVYFMEIQRGEDPPEAAAILLLGLESLLWPESESFTVNLLTRPTAADLRAAFGMSHAVIGPPARNLIDAGGADDTLLQTMGALEQVRQAQVRLPARVIRRAGPILSGLPLRFPRSLPGPRSPQPPEPGLSRPDPVPLLGIPQRGRPPA